MVDIFIDVFIPISIVYVFVILILVSWWFIVDYDFIIEHLFYKHKVELKPNLRTHKIKPWIIKNIPDAAFKIKDIINGGVEVRFKKESDALAFKLGFDYYDDM